MLRRYITFLAIALIFSGLVSCSSPQTGLTITPTTYSQNLSYTRDEVDYTNQLKSRIISLRTHMRNFDDLGKKAQPPYNDPNLLSNLIDELEKAYQEINAISIIKCPSSRFNTLCNDVSKLGDILFIYKEDMAQYYSSGFGESEKQKIIIDGNALNTISQNIANDYSTLENDYGKIQ